MKRMKGELLTPQLATVSLALFRNTLIIHEMPWEWARQQVHLFASSIFISLLSLLPCLLFTLVNKKVAPMRARESSFGGVMRTPLNSSENTWWRFNKWRVVALFKDTFEEVMKKVLSTQLTFQLRVEEWKTRKLKAMGWFDRWIRQWKQWKH